jgi:hypothetical protein
LTFDCRQDLDDRDVVDCGSIHDIEMHFHFPEYADVLVRPMPCICRGQSMTLAPDPVLRCLAISGDEARPLGWVSYRFDEKISSTTLLANIGISGSTTFRTTVTVL